MCDGVGWVEFDSAAEKRFGFRWNGASTVHERYGEVYHCFVESWIDLQRTAERIDCVVVAALAPLGDAEQDESVRRGREVEALLEQLLRLGVATCMQAGRRENGYGDGAA